jgi:hypothetical protein
MNETFEIKRGWRWLTPGAIVVLAIVTACSTGAKPAETVVAEAPPSAHAHSVTPDAIDRVTSRVSPSLPQSADAISEWLDADGVSVWSKFPG